MTGWIIETLAAATLLMLVVLALREPMKHAIGARAGQVASALGHVVVRVAPGGATYRVFVLDATSPLRPVTKTFGPYDAR
jgi:hypothetical protein